MTAPLDHLWQSTLFALPLGALTLLLRRHAAALRFWVWFAASVKFLVPFSVLMAMGAAMTLPVAPHAARRADARGAAGHGRAFHQHAGRKRRAGWDHELDHVADRDVGGRHTSRAGDLGYALA